MARKITWYACALVVILTIAGVPARAQDYLFGGLTGDLAEVAAQVDLQQAFSGQDQTAAPKSNPNPLQDRRDRIFYPRDPDTFKPVVRNMAGTIVLEQQGHWPSTFDIHPS